METLSPTSLGIIEYVAQITAHRSRLLRVARSLYSDRPLVIRVLDWHDAEKWIALPGLIFFRDHLNPDGGRRFYNAMNQLGELISDIVFFGEKSAFPEEYSFAKNVERVLDVLDRAQDPVSFREFGRIPREWRSYLNAEQIVLAEQIIEHDAWKNEFPFCNLIG